ncbi:MAG TPA: deoxyhypusine synthase [Candidatus Nanoarchaeia archaeon]|nr:deoxyhypusine synthase [Candidatus Nanoarchaeia archaeon]
MDDKNNEKTARKNLLRGSKEAKGTSVKGYDFNDGIDYDDIIKSFAATGYQATHFSRAIDIANKMISEKAFIYLGYTSNMVSSGLRDIFRYLVEHKKVDVIVTTAGGIEEDIIKCLGDFVIGEFRTDDSKLRKDGINRIGNIYVPNSRYIKFEEFFQPVLEEIYNGQKSTGNIFAPSDVIWKLGEKINDKSSICYWAWKNKIRIYCPAITDGAIGDNIYFFKYRKSDFIVDIAEDAKRLNDTSFGLKKSGVLILGSGVVKHHILNTNMLRNGADYAVYINNSQEFDGSDAGANPSEAVSWGKIIPDAQSVKVFGDATILFPLLVANSFAKK